MKEVIKNIGWGSLWLLMMGLSLAAFVVFVRGSVWAVTSLMDWISTINGILFCAIFILLILSMFPRLRIFTGLGITYAATLWGFLFWLICIAITYDFAGLAGVLVGFMFAGVGIFLTAIGGLFFDGQATGAAIMIANLVTIFAIRMLGVWIATKYRGQDNPISQSGSI